MTVDVSPQPTPTYNADQAFNPAANFGQNNAVQVQVATTQARIELSGTPSVGEQWIVTLNGTQFIHTVTSADTANSDPVGKVAAALRALIDPTSTYAASLDAADSHAVIVTSTGAFYAEFQIVTAAGLPASDGGANIASANGKTTIGLTGDPTPTETWTLTVDGQAHPYTVQFGDDLAAIATKLGALLPIALYDVSVSGRVITVNHVHNGGPVNASLAISSTSAGNGVVTAQLVFNQANWNIPQEVTVKAIDDNFVDGHDALVFPPADQRVDQIRGPIIIDGGVKVSTEPFLNNPALLPGEQNFPLPDGTLSAVGTVGGDATITDLFAQHVSAQFGQRPGFDPRMNDFSYTAEFLNGSAKEVTLDVASVSSDILSVTKTTPFSVSYTAPAGGSLIFSGTPSNQHSSTLWTEAEVDLTGLPAQGDTWTLTLGGTHYSYVVQPTDDVPSLIARALMALVPSTYSIQLRIGLLGDARLIITKAGGAQFTVDFTISSANGSAVVSGQPVSTGGSWTSAAFRFVTPGTSGSWTINLGGQAFTAAADGSVPDVTSALAAAITSDFAPLVSGSTVTFQTGFPTVNHATVQPSAGDEYVVMPLNLNTRVNEDVQVDTLNVFDNNDPSNSVGVLTGSTITGLGMGGDTVVGGETVPGGITYSEIENVDIQLGTGNDHFTIEGTSAGTTTVDSGAGNDTVDVKTIDGHTTVDTGSGNDIVNVGNAEGLVDSIDALLTLDTGTGTGSDTVNVNDAQDTNANAGTLTGSTLTGLDMPTVSEVQTVFVQANHGTYQLSAPGYGTATFDYTDDDATFTQHLQEIFGAGFNGVKGVTTSRTSTDVTYTVTFIRDQAGVNQPQLVWADKAASGLVPNLDASVNVLVTTVHDGSPTPPAHSNVQTIDVEATGTSPSGTYVLHFVRRTRRRAPGLRDRADRLERVRRRPCSPRSAPCSIRTTSTRRCRSPINVAVDQHGTTLHDARTRARCGSQSIAYIDPPGSQHRHGHARDAALRHRLLQRRHAERDLGSGDDVVNVQGTTATTNLSTGAGDDRVYVSSGANVGLADHPSFIGGTLDSLLGTLNIDAGTGQAGQTLMISDEAATAGDAHALITRDVPRRARRDVQRPPRSSSPARAQRDLDARPAATSPAGSRSGWASAPTRHRRRDRTTATGVNEVTTLNTGLGNDSVTVNLDGSTGGFFVLDTQGADQNVLHLATGLFTGDYNTPADQVSVLVNGTPLDAEPVRRRRRRSTRSDVLVSPDNGSVAAVQIGHTTTLHLVAGGSPTLALGVRRPVGRPGHRVRERRRRRPVELHDRHRPRHDHVRPRRRAARSGRPRRRRRPPDDAERSSSRCRSPARPTTTRSTPPARRCRSSSSAARATTRSRPVSAATSSSATAARALLRVPAGRRATSRRSRRRR